MSGDGVQQVDSAILAALGQRPASCWERLLDAADELVQVHGVPVEEVIARVRLALSAGSERAAAP